MNVLIVDDDEPTRQFLEWLLISRGHQVTAAGTGAEAWAAIERGTYPFVIFDWMLPDTDGPTLCRRLRSLPSGRNSLVLMITARSESEDMQAVLDAGADDYMSKPLDLRLLNIRLTIAERRANQRLEQSKTQQALQESEDRFRLLVENAPDYAIFMVDPEARIATWNTGAERILGYTTQQILGQPFARLYPPEAIATGLPAQQLARIDCDGRLEVEQWHARASGETFWGSLVLNSIRDGGQVCGRAAILRDMTSHRQAEAALKASEERAHAIIDAVDTGIITVWTNGCVEWMNPAASRIFGWDAGEIRGKPLATLLSDEQVPDLGTLLKAPGQAQELQGRRKDGSAFPLELSLRQLAEAQANLCVCTAHDLTERKRLEEHLRLSQKMEAVGKLAGGVAHDFNNLLFVISGRSELMLARLGPTDPLRRSVEEIAKTSERAASLTQQLLAFSRQQMLQPKVLDLNVIVSEMNKMLRRVIGEDIELQVHLSPDTARIKADPVQIQQVVMNLALNARDAMPEGGRLIVETGTAELDEKYAATHVGVRPGTYVLLSISDTGVGMDPETRARIFEPFFTTKELGKGSGLGLSTVYGIVKQSGGNIWVYSEPGRGTTFKIYLPLVTEAPRANTSILDVHRLSRFNETVLLVEDEDGVRNLIREILQGAGYTVVEAARPEDALQLAQSLESLHLLVSDVVMPGMNGPDLAAKATALRPSLRVLFISGYTDRQVLYTGVLAQHAAFLQKPFSPEQLLTKVRYALERPRT